jgi:hypothetical protein
VTVSVFVFLLHFACAESGITSVVNIWQNNKLSLESNTRICELEISRRTVAMLIVPGREKVLSKDEPARTDDMREHVCTGTSSITSILGFGFGGSAGAVGAVFGGWSAALCFSKSFMSSSTCFDGKITSGCFVAGSGLGCESGLGIRLLNTIFRGTAA